MTETRLQTQDWMKRAQTQKIDARPVLSGCRYDLDGVPSFASYNPATLTEVAHYGVCSAAEVGKAIERAQACFAAGHWSQLPIGARAAVFAQWSQLIEAKAVGLALCDSLEMGMPIAQALADINASAADLTALSNLASSLTTQAGVTRPGATCINYLEPLGVVGVITPWNFPFNQALSKIAPALIMGNSVVLKPSEVASASALLLADLAREAGLPDGALSVLTGTGAVTGAALAADPRLAKISFTGSTASGAAVQRMAANINQPTPVVMELGGKSAHVVCPSIADAVADIAPAIAHGVFWNAGQVCAAGTRLLVHEDLKADLLAALKEQATHFAPGDPFSPDTSIGPIATRNQYDRVTGFMQRGESEGAVPVTGGLEATQALPGLMAAPTIYDDVTSGSDLACQEIFGPVLAVSSYKTLNDAIDLANSSGYALTATAWTRDINEGHCLARALRGATVTINANPSPLPDFANALGFEPAGRSGFGRDFGMPGLEQFAQLKLVMFNAGSP